MASPPPHSLLFVLAYKDMLAKDYDFSYCLLLWYDKVALTLEMNQKYATAVLLEVDMA